MSLLGMGHCDVVSYNLMFYIIIFLDMDMCEFFLKNRDLWTVGIKNICHVFPKLVIFLN